MLSMCKSDQEVYIFNGVGKEEEYSSNPFLLFSPLIQTSRNGMTNLTLRLEGAAEPFEPLIGDINPGLIGLNGTKGKVFSRYCEFCQRVEKSRFANIWQSNLRKSIRPIKYIRYKHIKVHKFITQTIRKQLTNKYTAICSELVPSSKHNAIHSNKLYNKSIKA